MTFETVYMGLAGSLILVLIRVCLPKCHSGCLVTRELWARSIVRHLTTAWGKRQLSSAGLVYTDVCSMC